MSDSLVLSPPRTGGPPPTLEGRALFRMKAAALSDAPPPPPADPVVVLIAGENGGQIAFAPTAKIILLAEVRAGVKVKFFDR
ncbi:MAG: hypothetical protein AB7O04_07835 [Hyphomonadaceae bacterium]